MSNAERKRGLLVIQLLRGMRPKQWTKNFLIFAALIFAGRFSQLELILKVSLAFTLFCLLSGAIYLFNDLVDLRRDRLHPEKSNRPLAAGHLNPNLALVTGILLSIFSLAASFYLGFLLGLVALGYFFLHLAYFLFLKNIVILDVMTLALGYILRAVAGAVVISVEISPWLLVCTALLALFLSLGKRRHELIVLRGKAPLHRLVLKEYSSELLEEMISVTASSTVIAYSLYTFFSKTAIKTRYMMLTIPFVLYGIFRYLYLIHQKQEGGSPEEILLRDKPLIITILLWLLTVIAIFVFSKNL